MIKNHRVRVQLVIPEDLLREVEALAGQRKRSDFFVEAAREKVDRMKLRKAAHEFAGLLKDADTPHWETPEATSEWVRSLRRESDEHALPPGEAWYVGVSSLQMRRLISGLQG